MRHRALVLAVFISFALIGFCRGSCEFLVKEDSPLKAFVGNIIKCEVFNTPRPVFKDIGFFSDTPDMEYAQTFLELSDNGDILLKKPIDRDDPVRLLCFNDKLNCTKSIGVFFRTSEVTETRYFKLIIQDINDNSPVFSPGDLSFSVKENDFEEFLLPEATDADAAANGEVAYAVIDWDGGESLMKFDKLSRKVTLKSKLDYEKKPSYRIVVQACDKGRVSRCSNTTFVLNVIDANDNLPVFEKESYTYEISEDKYIKGSSYKFGSVYASDKDSGDLGKVTYRLQFTGSAAYEKASKSIKVDETSGNLYVIGPLDAKFSSKLLYTVVASDSAQLPRTSTASLKISILDVNDHAPSIKFRKWSKGYMTENEMSTNVAVFQVTDGDLGSNAKVSCHPGGDPGFKFVKSPASGEVDEYRVESNQLYDREETASVRLEIICYDNPTHGDSPKTTTVVQTIPIRDQNEFSPHFDSSLYTASVIENKSNKSVVRVRAVDKDATSVLEYSILEESSTGKFWIDSRSGEIRTALPLDREQLIVNNDGVAVYLLTVTASDGSLSATAKVEITVDDMNDCTPSIDKSTTNFTVIESFGNNSERRTIGKLQYTDDDESGSRNAIAQFRLEQVLRQSGSVKFYLTPEGVLTSSGCLDRELDAFYKILVEVKDLGSPPLSSTATVTVYLLDLNDNAPIIHKPRTGGGIIPHENISDEYVPGFSVFEVEATDADLCSGPLRVNYMTFKDCMRIANFTMSLTQRVSFFSINNLGQIKVRNPLSPGRFVLNITVTDNSPPGPLSSSVSFVVNVNRQPRALYFGKHNWNWTILLVIIVVSTFVTVILVVAIVMLNRNQPCIRRGGPSGRRYDGSSKEQNGFEVDVVYPDGRRLECLGPLTTFGHSHTPMHGDTFRRENGLAPNGLHHPGNIYAGDLEVASADSGHGASEEEAMFEHRNATLPLDQRLLAPSSFPMRSRSPVCNCSSLREDDSTMHSRRCPEHVPLTSGSATFGKMRPMDYKPLNLLSDPQFNTISLSSAYHSLSRPHITTQSSVLSPIAGSRCATPDNFYSNLNSAGSVPPHAQSQALHSTPASQAADV